MKRTTHDRRAAAAWRTRAALTPLTAGLVTAVVLVGAGALLLRSSTDEGVVARAEGPVSESPTSSAPSPVPSEAPGLTVPPPTMNPESCLASQEIGSPEDRTTRDASSGRPGDFGRVEAPPDYPWATTEELIRGVEVVAVLRVVGRDWPVQRDGGSIGRASQPDPSKPRIGQPSTEGKPPRSRIVVRPVRYRVERTLKGEAPRCLELEVPGGEAGNLFVETLSFPRVIRVGDRVVVYMSTLSESGDGTRGLPVWASSMFPVGPDGRAHVAGNGTINVDAANWLEDPGWKPGHEGPNGPEPPAARPNTPPSSTTATG